MRVEGFESIDKLVQKFDKMDGQSEEMFHEALYKGAGVIADSIKSRINSLPIQENENGKAPWGTSSKPLTGITSTQKDGLIAGFGIAKHRKEGGAYTTSVGFHGNNADGKSNAGIARAVESGSSFRKKTPFVRPAFNAARARAEEVMKKTILEKIKEIK